MSKYKVLLTDYAWPDLDVERAILEEAGAELIVADSAEPTRLVELARDADAIMTCWAQTTAEVIRAATNCRLVARMGIGLDNIDVGYCTEHGIPVTNVPDYCVVEVAEHTLALIFALARNVAQFHHSSKMGQYDLRAAPALRRIEGTTLGVVGLGRIGRLVAEKALALGMNVLACTRQTNSAVAGVRFVGLHELLAASDFVSLHLPLTEETTHLIGASQLAAMQRTSYLINTARGGLVDHRALAAALGDNRLAGAALDVQEPEPPPLDEPPFSDSRVIVTPHAAFVSDHSLVELRRRSANQVAVCLSGGIPENIVNPTVIE